MDTRTSPHGPAVAVAVAVLAEFLLLFAGMRLVEKVASAVSSILLAFAPRPLFRRE